MHGGDTYRNLVELDFSVNISPLGVPEGVREALEDALLHVEEYPDLHCEKLVKGLSLRHGLKEDYIICGNGASEVIMAICHAVMPERAVLTAPGFGGYEHALNAAGAEVFYYYLKEETGFGMGEDLFPLLEKIRPSIFFIANPNNPSGKAASPGWMERIAKICARTGTILVIDECFSEMVSENKDVSFEKRLFRYPNVVILKAFTKSFSIPGIRLGYCLCSDLEVAKRIRGQLPEWNVSVPAQMAGAAALKVEESFTHMREVVERERKYLIKELSELVKKVFPSDANYLLFFDDRNWYELLLREKILIRDCSDYIGLGKGYYRIAVKHHKHNERLMGKMREMIENEEG